MQKQNGCTLFIEMDSVYISTGKTTLLINNLKH